MTADSPVTPWRKTNGSPSTVAIVDRIPAFGAGLAAIVEQGGFQAVQPNQPVSWLRRSVADVVVMSVHAPADLARLGKLADRFPELVIVAVLHSVELTDYVRAMQSGAHAAVGWCSSPAEIIEVIQAAMAGRTVLPTKVARSLATLAPGHDPNSPLSVDEIRWLRALGSGRSVVELARAEGYSQREIFRRLAEVYRRMGARNRQEAIALAGQWGLLTATAPAAHTVNGHRRA